MYQKNYTITGELFADSNGYYKIIDTDGKIFYFPITLTIVEEV